MADCDCGPLVSVSRYRPGITGGGLSAPSWIWLRERASFWNCSWSLSMMVWTGLLGHCGWSWGWSWGVVGVGRAVFIAERTLVTFLTIWEAEVKFETSEPCPPAPGGLWDRVEDADIRLAFFSRIDIFRLPILWSRSSRLELRNG